MSKGVKNEFGLTPQQELFCTEYLKIGVAYKAYRIAFPRSVNWKDETVYTKASKLLKRDEVKTRLSILNKETAEKVTSNLALNKNKVLQEIVKTYQETTQSGASERTNSVALLKLMSQISKLIGENQTNIQVNVQNNVVGEVTDFLDL